MRFVKNLKVHVIPSVASYFFNANCVIQVENVKKEVMAEMEMGRTTTSNAGGMRRELMRMPNSHQIDIPNQYIAKDNDDFVSSEADRQFLLVK